MGVHDNKFSSNEQTTKSRNAPTKKAPEKHEIQRKTQQSTKTEKKRGRENAPRIKKKTD